MKSHNKVLILSVFVRFNTDLGLCGGFDLEICLWMRGLGPVVVYVVVPPPPPTWCLAVRFLLLQHLFAAGSLSLFSLIFVSPVVCTRS